MSYSTVIALNKTPVPSTPLGSWSNSGNFPRWFLRAQCDIGGGNFVESTIQLPAAFCEFDNANGKLRFSRCFIDPSKITNVGASNAYAVVGGSFVQSSRNIEIVFQADVKNMQSEYVTSAVVVEGKTPIRLGNNNGQLVQE